MPPRFPIERLGRHHDRAAFSCGEASLDAYVHRQARQDDDRNVAKVFVLVDPDKARLAGYYTLSAPAVHLETLPSQVQRSLPRYPLVPVVLLGRLAVDQEYQGRGFGEALLLDALRRAFAVGTEHIAAASVVVDVLDDRARSFYERYGFLRFPEVADRLYLPMRTLAQVAGDRGS